MKMQTHSKPLKSEELTYFCTQLALILKSGVTLNDGLLMLLDDTTDTEAMELVAKIIDVVEQEKKFYIALEETGAFPKYFVSMVKIGEMTGHLDNVLEGLAGFYERETNLKSSIRGAIMHPLILLFMMSAVVGILIVKVLPIFRQVFVQLGTQMNSTSAASIEFASSTGVVILVIVAIILILSVLLYIASRWTRGRVFIMSAFSDFIIFKSILDKMSICRFSSAMSLMISSGIETSEALELGEGVISNKKLALKIAELQEKVNNHQPFAQAITEVNIFPTLYSQMIKISYKTGSLDTVWSRIASTYDDDVTESLNNIVSFIEPLLIGVLSVIIGVILISVMLPLMGVMSSIG